MSTANTHLVASVEKRFPLPLPGESHPQPAKSERDPDTHSLYLKYAKENDSDTLSQWNTDIDVHLIFAALFSAIVTAFLIGSLGDLRENYTQTSSELLKILVSQSLNQTSAVTLPPPFQADPSSVIVNSLWAASIILSLSAALVAILCKQWLREYTARLSPIPSVRATQRHKRYKAFKRWRMSGLIALLPAMLHIAVALFFAALVVYLRPINETVSVVASAMIWITGVAYLAFFLLPFFTAAPFITPLTRHVRELVFNLVLATMMGIAALVTSVLVGFSLFCCCNLKATKAWPIIMTLARDIQRYIVVIARVPNQQGVYQGEESRAELLSWLMHSPLEDDDIPEVVHALSEIKGQRLLRMFEDDGVEVMLIHRMESFCFYHGPEPNTIIKAIPERVPLALSCLDVWFNILGSGVVVVGHDTCSELSTKGMLEALLKVTDGLDNMRVLASSLWLAGGVFRNEYSPRIQRHLIDHIEGVAELPDDVVRIFVDDPHSSVDFSPEIIRLLQKYLDRDSLPPIDCIRAILLNLNNCHSGIDLIRERPPSHLIATLLDTMENGLPQLLHLIRSLSSLNPSSVRNVHLAKSLINLLKRSPPLDEVILVDVWKTISHAPECCHMYNQALLGLAKLYQRHTSSAISRASITAIAAFIESLVYPVRHKIRGLEEESLGTVDIIVESLTNSPGACMDIDILLPGVYTLSLIADMVNNNMTTHTQIIILLPHLLDILRVPHSKRHTAVIQHALRVIDQILYEDVLKGSMVTRSLAILEQLAICDDFWIRSLAYDILKSTSYHLSRDDRQRMLKVIKDDIERRLNSPTSTAFIDRNWRELMDAGSWISSTGKLETPTIVLALEINADIDSSGIRELLESAPTSMICGFSVYTTEPRDHVPWLHPFHKWVRDNL